MDSMISKRMPCAAQGDGSAAPQALGKQLWSGAVDSVGGGTLTALLSQVNLPARVHIVHDIVCDGAYREDCVWVVDSSPCFAQHVLVRWILEGGNLSVADEVSLCRRFDRSRWRWAAGERASVSCPPVELYR
jgi:hypothetical protein